MADDNRPTETSSVPKASPMDHGPTAAPGRQSQSVGKSKERSGPQPTGTLGQLIRTVYQGRFKRTSLKKAEVDLMRRTPLKDASERTSLLELAASDRLLEKTRQLMLLGIQNPGLSSQIQDFGRDVLARHPLFAANDLRALLSNLAESIGEEDAVDKILSTDTLAVFWPEDAQPPREKQWAQCLANAVHCMLLLFRGARGTSLNRIQRILRSKLWPRMSRDVKGDAEQLEILLTIKDPRATSVVDDLLQGEMLDQKRRAGDAMRDVARATERLASFEVRTEELEQKLTQALSDNIRLVEERDEQRRAHESAMSHWSDDYQKLRGQFLHKLDDSVTLLEEGLHALRRESPKVHVMIDHAERVMDGLKREAERLRRRG